MRVSYYCKARSRLQKVEPPLANHAEMQLKDPIFPGIRRTGENRLPAEYQEKEASDSREDPVTVHIYLA